ncbi:MAG: S9 family peptidase [Chloroflexia bacterium]|nr:S9 family peptidase [Chloroflexia bacterium]
MTTTKPPTVAPYGAWRSPITTELLTGATVGLGGLIADGEDVYWLESRASDGGRSVLVRRTPDGERRDVTPAPFNVRSRVHEYGGGAYAVASGLVIFSYFADNRLYRVDIHAGGEPEPITPDGAWRYADLQIDRAHNRLICVREDHTVADAEPVNTIVQLSLHGPNDDGGRIIVSGTDFVASPTLSATGDRLAWLAWSHPNMPWDGCELWSADLTDTGDLDAVRHIAGGADESVFQPRWADDAGLFFVSDRSGWWNLYRADPSGAVEPLCAMEAEFGLPQWVFGMSTYDQIGAGWLVCAWTRDGVWHLGALHVASRRLTPFDLPFTEFEDIRVAGAAVLMLAGSPTEPWQVVSLNPNDGSVQTLRRSSDEVPERGYLTAPKPISWPTPDGALAHGFFYPPANQNYTAPDGERPPLIVESHGGPTGATSTVLSLDVQFWTSRGFAVLDVNYGGSTGYGRAYRERLNGQWGIVDVDDCVSGAEHLVAQDLVDGRRLIIRGGSAGGYTTLAALTFRDTFAVGASHYGIGDLEALAVETHKFESRYLDGLVGPYPAQRATYVERSPIHHVERLSCSLILLQGLEDKVVPPNQAATMAEAVAAKGLPVAHLTFEGEGHGFRRADSIRRALDAELSFYSRIFGFDLADPIQPVPITNMP